MEIQQLTAVPLEEAVASVLQMLEAEVRRGPKGEHDLEVSFPRTFVRQIGREHTARLNVNKRIVVEVKSDLKGGAGISDLRQLHDWVLRESRRVLPAEELENSLFALEQTKLEAEYRFLDDESFDYSKGEMEDARAAVLELIEAVDLALMSMAFRVKGLLVINHHAAAAENKRARVIESNALPYAQANHLAVITWQKLQEVAARIGEGALDPINFWCRLFETDGVFELVEYDWMQESTFQHTLFGAGELTVTSEVKFLRPEPESMLSRVRRNAAEPTLRRIPDATGEGQCL
jgi:hypothetical protein